AKSPAPCAHPRLSRAHGVQELASGPQAPTRQGAQEADGFVAVATASPGWRRGMREESESSSAAARRAGVGPREQVEMPAMPSERFAKSRRMRRRGEFQHVFDLSHRTKARYFTLLMA